MVRKLFAVLILVTIFSIPLVNATWQPTVGNFRITNFPDFGEVADTKTLTLTITCIEGGGSAQISFTTEPNGVPISFTPNSGTPSLSEGESYTHDFDILNLGTETNLDFGINATVNNSLGEITDTKTAYGTLLEKTGEPTTQQFTPNPKITDVNPAQLPDIGEGETTPFNITIRNSGTEGTVSISCSSDSWSFTPLTATTKNMQPDESFTFRFRAHALNVLENKNTTIEIFTQGRGGTDTYTLHGRILDVEGYTPPSGDKTQTQSDNDQNQLYLIIILLIAIVALLIGILIWVTQKRQNKKS